MAVKNNALAYIRTNNKYLLEELNDDIDLFVEESIDSEMLEDKKKQRYNELDNLSENNRRGIKKVEKV
ncbi:MAG: hypothetical protein JEZ01_10030 [Labilibaculum sp.]|nr:hypothetical protein [Labilibaculum sp.]MBI9058094.1 hypothetical protein [Labilibaculum sp.]